MTVEMDALVDALGDCVGRERAREIIKDVCDEMGHDASTCTEPEAIEVTVRLANQENASPYVRTAAQTVQTRIQAGHI